MEPCLNILLEIPEQKDTILCVFITTNDKKWPTYVDDAISGGGTAISKNSITSAL